MKTGSPPTAPNARAGLFTPPGIRRFARSNAAWLLDRSMRCGAVAGGEVVGRSQRPGGEELVGLVHQLAEVAGLALVQVADVAEDVPSVLPAGGQFVGEQGLRRGQLVGND